MKKNILILIAVLFSLDGHAQYNNLATNTVASDLAVIMRQDAAGNWSYANIAPNKLNIIAGGSEDDLYEKSQSVLAPSMTPEWLSAWSDSSQQKVGGGNSVWRIADDFSAYIYAEGAGDPAGGYKGTGYSFVTPLGTTSVVFSASFKVTPDTNGTSVNFGFIDVAAGGLPSVASIPLTTAFTLVSKTNAVNTAYTNIGLFFYGGGFSMMNPTVTFYPSPTNPVLANGFNRYTPLDRNTFGGSYHSSGYLRMSPLKYQPAANSSVEFKTDARMVTFEISADLYWQSPTTANDLPWLSINGGTNIPLAINTNSILQLTAAIYLPTNQINTLRVYNSHSVSGYVNWLRAVYVPAGNTVQFTKSAADNRLLVYGDSISDGDASTNLFSTPFYVGGKYSGYDVTLISDGNAALPDVSGLAGVLGQVSTAKPNVFWVAMGVNNYLNNTTSNQFYTSLNYLVEQSHRLAPQATIVLQTLTGLATETANSASMTAENYRSSIRYVATNYAHAAYCKLAEANGWFTTPAPTGNHPSQSSNVKYGYMIATNLENVALNFRQTNYFDYFGATNAPANGNALRFDTAKQVFYFAP